MFNKSFLIKYLNQTLLVLSFLSFAFSRQNDFSLAQILNMEINVASKVTEKQSDAPSAVTAYSRENLDLMGYTTLKDLATITPGYYNSEEYNDYYFITRGNLSQTNSKHIVIYDGIPINNARGNNGPMHNELPLDFVERVEFLRGPASSLYGLSAFNGVINITPRELDEEGYLTQAKFGVGSENFNTNDRHASLAEMNFSGNHVIHRDGMQYNLTASYFTQEANRKDNSKNRNNEDSYFINSKMKVRNAGILDGLSLGWIYLKRMNGYGQGWGTQSSGWTGTGYNTNDFDYHHWVTSIFYVQFEKEFNEKHHLSAYYKVNTSQEKGGQANNMGWWGNGFSAFTFDVYTISLELNVENTYTPTDDISLVYGINTDTRRILKNSYTLPIAGQDSVYLSHFYDKPHYTFSGFAQLRKEFNFLKGTIATIGGRYDRGSGEYDLQNSGYKTYDVFSPKLALVQKLTPKLNFKGSYAQAFKAPGIEEVAHNIEKSPLLAAFNDTNTTGLNITLGALQPEIIKTTEGGITYSTQNFECIYTVFYNTTIDQLDRSFIAPNLNTDLWVNSNTEYEAVGFEVDVKYTLTKNILLFMNHSFSETWNQVNGGALPGPPSHTNNHGGIFKWEHFNLFVVGKWNHGFRSRQSGGSATDGKDLSGHPIDYLTLEFLKDESSNVGLVNGDYVVDTNLRYKISESSTLNLSIHNLFNTTRYFTDTTWERPDRELMLNIKTTF